MSLVTPTTNRRKVHCCIIFPDQLFRLFELIADRCFKTFEEAEVEYTLYKYEGLNRNDIQRIISHLQGSCILILGYDNEALLMQFYKLGLAHAYGRHAIVIGLEENYTFKMPEFIGNTFWIPISLEKPDLNLITVRVRQLVMMVLKGDVGEMLYQEACEICDSESRSNAYPIPKVSKEEFLQRLSGENISPLLSDLDALRCFLLQKIVTDQNILVYLYLIPTQSSSKASSKQRVEQPQLILLGDIVCGDKIGQDKVQGDKTEYL